MNFSILKHSFWAFGVLLMACNKSATARFDLTNANTSAPPAAITTKQQNLLWIPVENPKTLQTAKDLLGNGTVLTNPSANTRFIKPNTNPTGRTGVYYLNVNVADIKPRGLASDGIKSTFLGIRLAMQEGLTYTVFKSPYNDHISNNDLSFAVVTENASATDAKLWKATLQKQLNLKSKSDIYASANTKHTLVLLNGSGNERATTNLFKAGERIVLLLVAINNKNYTSQTVSLVINFVSDK